MASALHAKGRLGWCWSLVRDSCRILLESVPKHMKLGKRQCLWIPTTPADTARNAKKSLKCTLSSSMSMVLDSAGVGSGGGKLTVTQDSAGVGSGGMHCSWVSIQGADTTTKRVLVCTLALQLTVDSAGVGSGGGHH